MSPGSVLILTSNWLLNKLSHFWRHCGAAIKTPRVALWRNSTQIFVYGEWFWRRMLAPCSSLGYIFIFLRPRLGSCTAVQDAGFGEFSMNLGWRVFNAASKQASRRASRRAKAAPSQLRLRQALLASLPLTAHELGEWENLGPLNTGCTMRRRCCDTVGGGASHLLQSFCVVTGSPLTRPSLSLSLSLSCCVTEQTCSIIPWGATESWSHAGSLDLLTCRLHVYSPSPTRIGSLLFTTIASANYVLTCRPGWGPHRATRFN